MSTVPTDTPASQAPGAGRAQRFHFAVYALPEPCVMPRVLEQFAKRDLVPTRWHSAVVDGPDAELQIDVQVDNLEAETGHYIARCLSALVNVNDVVTSAG